MNQDNSTKSKIIKISGVCEIISKVIYILCIIGFFISLVLAIVFPTTGIIKSMTNTESCIMMVVITLYCFFLVGLLWNVQQLFHYMKINETPFSKETYKYMKKIAYFIILVSFIPAIIGSIFIHSLFDESELVFSIEITGIISGIVFMLFALIFKYGLELQIKDDETL